MTSDRSAEKQASASVLSSCRGRSGCPHAACTSASLIRDISSKLEAADIPGFLNQSLSGPLRAHHSFKVAIAGCPNACSRPQIVDIGIICAVLPGISDAACSKCGTCVTACREKAIFLADHPPGPVLNPDRCLMCTQCIRNCPTGHLYPQQKGFRVMIGGRLGRHPRLAMEIPGIKTHEQVLGIVGQCLEFYKTHSTDGARFSHLFSTIDQVIA